MLIINFFFANYVYNPRIKIKPKTLYLKNLLLIQQEKFFKTWEIANKIEIVYNYIIIIAKQLQDWYKKNANKKKKDILVYKKKIS